MRTEKKTTPVKRGLIYRYVDLLGQCEQKSNEIQYALELSLRFVPSKEIKKWIDLTEKEIINQQTNNS